MMAAEPGRIFTARCRGAYMLKLVGDVRVNLCAAIDDYLRGMFDDPEFDNVVIDVCDAEGIDSTTLGQLAKLSLQLKRRCGFYPVVYSSNPGISRLLRSMAFDRIFDIRDESCADPEAVRELPGLAADPAAAREKVIEAHRTLMNLSEENREKFQDLVSVLEEAGA